MHTGDNYTRVTHKDCSERRELAPARRHHEAEKDDPEAHKDVSVAETGNGKFCPAHVEDDDPDQAEQHQAEHDRFEPNRVWRIVSPAIG